jgi:hypothetical protein
MRVVKYFDGFETDSLPSVNLIGGGTGLDLVNIKDFSAVGDGTTDNSTPIQNAIQYAIDNNKPGIFIPDGTFAISQPIIVPSDFVIMGINSKGAERSCIKPLPGWNTSKALIESKNVTTERQRRILIKGIYLDCASTANYGIRFFTQDSKIEDVTIKYGWTYGIWIHGIGNSTPDDLALNNFIHDCFIQGNSSTKWWNAIFVDYYTGDTNIVNSYLEGSNNALIKSRGANDIVNSNHLYDGDLGIYFETNDDRTVVGNYIENIKKEGIFIDGGSSSNQVLNATISGNTFRNINRNSTSTTKSVVLISGSNIKSTVISSNVLRKDSSLTTGGVSDYFVYFSSLTGLTQNNCFVSGNKWQDGLVTNGESNFESLFKPSPHTHGIGDLTGVAPATHSHDWVDITGKPTTFPPSPHTHSMSDVTGLNTALAGKADTVHTHSWGDITGKPYIPQAISLTTVNNGANVVSASTPSATSAKRQIEVLVHRKVSGKRMSLAIPEIGEILVENGIQGFNEGDVRQVITLKGGKGWMVLFSKIITFNGTTGHAAYIRPDYSVQVCNVYYSEYSNPNPVSVLQTSNGNALFVIEATSFPIQAVIHKLNYNTTTQNYEKDWSFSRSLNGFFYSAIISPDDNFIYLGGLFSSAHSNNIFKINTTNGSIDSTFNTNTQNKFNAEINTIALHPNGFLLIGGYFTNYNSVSGKSYLIGLNTNGSENTTFSSNIVGKLNDAVTAVTTTAGTDFYIAGWFTNYNSINGLSRLAKLDINCNSVSSFNSSIINGVLDSNSPEIVRLQEIDGVLVVSFSSHGRIKVNATDFVVSPIGFLDATNGQAIENNNRLASNLLLYGTGTRLSGDFVSGNIFLIFRESSIIKSNLNNLLMLSTSFTQNDVEIKTQFTAIQEKIDGNWRISKHDFPEKHLAYIYRLKTQTDGTLELVSKPFASGLDGKALVIIKEL